MAIFAITVMCIIIFGPALLATVLYINRKRNYRKAVAHWDRLQREMNDHEYLD